MRNSCLRLLALIALIGWTAEAFAQTPESRASLIARAQVWQATDVGAMDLRRGPSRSGGSDPGDTIHCDFVDRPFQGKSPKFACVLPDGEEVKVKFGETNGEVPGEVAATRLLWALGFGADLMYPVRVICRGCPEFVTGAEDARTRESPGHLKGGPDPSST